MNNLKKILKDRKITYAEFGEMLGVSGHRVWELANKQSFSYPYLYIFAKVLKVDISELLMTNEELEEYSLEELYDMIPRRKTGKKGKNKNNRNS